MDKTRLVAVEIAAQVVLALAIGLSVSLILAGAALLLAESGAPSGEQSSASEDAAVARA